MEHAYQKRVLVDEQSIVLEVLDTGGKDDYASLREQWIRDGEGFVLVYSITSKQSFNLVQNFYQQVQEVKKSGDLVKESSVPIMLVGNKSDKQYERKVSLAEGLALAKELDCPFMETSAMNAANVKNAFYHVAQSMHGQTHQPSSHIDQGTATGSGCITKEVRKSTSGSLIASSANTAASGGKNGRKSTTLGRINWVATRIKNRMTRPGRRKYACIVW